MTNKQLLQRIDSIIIREGFPEPGINEKIIISGDSIHFLCSYGRQKIGILKKDPKIKLPKWKTLLLDKKILKEDEKLDSSIKIFLQNAFIKKDSTKKIKEEKEIELVETPDENILNIIQTQLIPGKIYKTSSIVDNILKKKLKKSLSISDDIEIEKIELKREINPTKVLNNYNKIVGKFAKNTSILFDLLKVGQFPKSLDILVIDDNPEIRILCIVDFLLVWQIAQRFSKKPFPIERIRIYTNQPTKKIIGFDKLVEAYISEIDHYPPKEIAFHQRIKKALQNIVYLEINETINLSKNDPSFIVINNYFSTLLDDSTRKDFENNLSNLSENTIISLVEEADTENNKKSTELFSWRKDILENTKKLISILPCGQEFGKTLPSQCNSCFWQKIISSYQYESYVKNGKILCNEKETLTLYSFNSIKILGEKESSLQVSGELPLLSLGLYSNKGKDDFNIHGALGEQSFESKSDGMADFLKLCPGNTKKTKLALKRNPGQYIPTHEFGKRFKILSEGKTETRDDAEIISITHATGYHEYKLEYSAKNTRFIKLNPSRRKKEFPKGVDPAVMDVLAYRYFGFEKLFGFQQKVMNRSLTGKDILAIAATGGGKSECYIMPSLILPGITIVISPLISLMQDQYEERLKRRYKLHHLSAYINSTLTFEEKQRVLNNIANGKIKILFITPEQLDNAFVIHTLKSADDKIGVRYLALDEAHCISQWGHDFRPAYLNIRKKLQHVGIDPVIIALTATASDPVKNDICQEVDLNPDRITDETPDGDVHVFESNRKELNLITKTFTSTDKKIEFIYNILKNNGKDPTLLFMPWAGTTDYLTKKDIRKRALTFGKEDARVSYLAVFLEKALKEKVSIYHGRLDENADDIYKDFFDYQTRWGHEDFGVMSKRSRRYEQNSYMRGLKRIMVATKGFGMGVDKSDVRCVIHRTSPDNLESYMQEAGRAGRDRRQANVYLLYSPDKPTIGDKNIPSDYDIQDYFISDRYIKTEFLNVMQEFFKWILKERINQTVKKNKSKSTRIFFTNDQFIDFVDEHHSSIWPDFRPEEDLPPTIRGELEEDLYNKGLIYEKKTDSLKKIISVVYKIRPQIGRFKNRFYMFEKESQQRDKIIKPIIKDFDAILQSNYYFGKIFRDKKISEEEFSELFMNKKDAFELSKYLKMDLQETIRILTDIKQSHGEPLSFKFFGTSYKTVDDPFDTNSKEGFIKYGISDFKKWKNEKIKVKNQTGSWPHYDDYNEIDIKLRNIPTGWDVIINDDILTESYYNKYNEEFDKIHKEREAVDWASYRRLLSSYIGVNEDGSLVAKKEGKRYCLREVMLGYLNSVELVKDGNCKSCSVCVPDLKFDKFDEEERNAQIINAEPLTIVLKKGIDEDYITKVPTLKELDTWIETFNKDESSIWGYLEGFTNKLLADYNGNHVGALFLRLKLYQSEKLEFQPKDFITISRSILKIVSKSNLNRVETLISNTTQIDNENAEYFSLMLDIHEKREDEGKAYKLIQSSEETIVGFSKDQQRELRNKELRLSNVLNRPKDEIIDIEFSIAALISNYEEAEIHYGELIKSIVKDRVINEIERRRPYLEDETKLALFLFWKKSDDFDIDYVKKQFKLLTLRFSPHVPWDIVLVFIEEELDRHVDLLLDILVNHSSFKDEFIHVIFDLLLKTINNPSLTVKSILDKVSPEWYESELLMDKLEELVFTVKLSEPIHKPYLDKVSKSYYIARYVLWYALQDEKTDSQLSEMSKKMFQYCKDSGDSDSINKLVGILLKSDRDDFPKSTYFVQVLLLLVGAEESVIGENSKDGRRDNAKYYYNLADYFRKQIWDKGEFDLDKKEIAYIWYLVFNKGLDKSKYLTLRKIQAEAMGIAGMLGELKELDKKMPGIEMGRERIPLSDFIEKINKENPESIESIEVLNDNFQFFNNMNSSVIETKGGAE